MSYITVCVCVCVCACALRILFFLLSQESVSVMRNEAHCHQQTLQVIEVGIC